MTNESIQDSKSGIKRSTALGITLAISVLLLVLGACSTLPLNFGTGAKTTSGRPTTVKVGDLAPEIDLPALGGSGQMTLSKLAGHPILINFWATWCGPCRQEFPALVRKYKQYQDQGFIVLAVNTQDPNSDEGVQTFARNTLVNFPIVRDRSDQLGIMYNIRGLPTSIFVDRKGIVRDVVIGGPMEDAFIDQKFNLINQ